MMERTMKRALARVQVRLMAAREMEWHVLIAACAIVAVFIVIMTGHVSLQY